VARLAELLNDRISDLAVALLGTPNRELSSQQQLRFGAKGSVAVEIAGKDAGRWYDHEAGTGGAGLELIRHHLGLDEKPAWDWARNWLGEQAMPSSWTAKPATTPASGAAKLVEMTDAERATKVADIVRQTESPNGTPAHAYLRGRGIAIQPPDCIRFRQNAYGSYGAMVALATDATGEVLAIQQVYLTAEGKKAPLNPIKRTNKAVEGWAERSAVRLPGRKPLVLCEGVETALSIWQATGQEVWACLGIANIARAPVPEKAMVIIARDGDAQGSKAEGQTRLLQPRAVVLHGRTAENGKSQILQLARGLLPANAICCVPASQMGDDKHVLGMVGKLLNASDELSAEAIASDAFKAVVTGDPLQGRDVYKSRVEFRSVAQNLFATNNLPSFKGGVDRGVQRRLLVISFARTIPLEERIADIGLRIASDEADLLLAWAVHGAARLIRQRNFAIPESCHQALLDWVLGEDPVLAWIDACVRVQPIVNGGPMLATRDAHLRFQNWALAEGFKTENIPAINGFVQRVQAQVAGIQHKRTSTGRFFLGITVTQG
jgi:hypothetical protein